MAGEAVAAGAVVAAEDAAAAVVVEAAAAEAAVEVEVAAGAVGAAAVAAEVAPQSPVSVAVATRPPKSHRAAAVVWAMQAVVEVWTISVPAAARAQGLDLRAEE